MAASPEPPVSDRSTGALSSVQAELASWGQAHPRATFAKIEAAVERLLGELRAARIDERLPTEDAVRNAERPSCATCGVALVARGRRRRLRVLGDQAVTLEREHWTCPQCAGGLFPPR